MGSAAVAQVRSCSGPGAGVYADWRDGGGDWASQSHSCLLAASQPASPRLQQAESAHRDPGPTWRRVVREETVLKGVRAKRWFAMEESCWLNCSLLSFLLQQPRRPQGLNTCKEERKKKEGMG